MFEYRDIIEAMQRRYFQVEDAEIMKCLHRTIAILWNGLEENPEASAQIALTLLENFPIQSEEIRGFCSRLENWLQQ